MNMEELAKRLQVLEDIEAIKKMKAEFHALCDEGYQDLDGIMDFFVEDGVWAERRLAGMRAGPLSGRFLRTCRKRCRLSAIKS